MRGSIEDISVQAYSSGIITTFDYTGGSGAGFDFDISMSDPNTNPSSFLFVLLCTNEQMDNFILSNYDARSLCMSASETDLQKGCFYANKLGPCENGTATVTLQEALPYTARSTLEYFFVTCPGNQNPLRMSSLTISSNFHSYNPGGEELSMGEIPLKTMSPQFLAVWLVGFFIFAANLVYAALFFRVTKVVTLHFVLCLPPLFFAFEGLVGWQYWNSVSKSGVDNLSLSVVDVLLWDVASSINMLLVVRLARGWSITRPSLTYSENRVTFLLVVGYLFFWGYWQYSNSIAGLFALLVIYGFIMRYAISSTFWSLKLLELFRSFTTGLGLRSTEPAAAQRSPSPTVFSGGYQSLGAGGGENDTEQGYGNSVMGSLNGGNDNGSSGSVSITDGGLSASQIAFLTRFRYITVLYISVDILCEIASDLLFSSAGAPWVTYLTQQLSAIALWVFLSFSFRARSRVVGPLYDERGYIQANGEGLDHSVLESAVGRRLLSDDSAQWGAAAHDVLSAPADSTESRIANAEGGGSHIVVDAGNGQTVVAEKLVHSSAAFGGRVLPVPPAAYK